MKKIVVLSALLITWPALMAGCFNNQSFSFLLTRPAQFNLPAYQSVWHDFLYNKKGSMQASAQFTTYFQDSRDEEKIARYFLFNNKSGLRVAGDTTVASDVSLTKLSRDVRAEWLGLPADFDGRFCLRPHQKQIGYVFEYNQNFGKFFSWQFFDQYWLGIEIPVLIVENCPNLTQTEIKNPNLTGTGPKDIIEALQQPAWHYAKLGPATRKIELAEITLRFGRAFVDRDYLQIASYNKFSFPTGTAANPEIIFDATTGTNRHWALGSGVNFNIVLNEDISEHAFCFFTDVETMFLVKRNQCRTVDLKNRPWSRYLLYNARDTQTPNVPIPGVNVLTRLFIVHPYCYVEASAGWRVKTKNFEAEIGYSVWGHPKERLELEREFPENFYGIAGNKDQANPNMPTTASLSTISVLRAVNDPLGQGFDKDADGNPLFIPITLCDLDFDSGARQGTILHRLHIAAGGEFHAKSIEGFFGAGVFYEFPHQNTALKVWGFWIKMGGSF